MSPNTSSSAPTCSPAEPPRTKPDSLVIPPPPIADQPRPPAPWAHPSPRVDMPLHLYDLTALSAVDLTSRAIAFLVAHPLRATDEAALDSHSASRVTALASEVFHSERVWVVTDDAHRPMAMLGLRRFGGEDGLMWAVAHPSLEAPTDELRNAVTPALAEITALRPRLWAWKAPQDRPEALPRLDRDAGDDLTLIGPEPPLDSPVWIDWFQVECFDLTRTCAAE